MIKQQLGVAGLFCVQLVIFGVFFRLFTTIYCNFAMYSL